MTNLHHMSTFALLILSGCSMGVYEDAFDCPADRGTGCLSLSEVNQKVDRGELGVMKASQIKTSDYVQKKPCCVYPSKQAFPTVEPLGQKIWIAPHSDAQGHRVDGHYVILPLGGPL